MQPVLKPGPAALTREEREMNEATQEQLAELVKWLRETAQAGQAFVAGQAPDLAREIIAYNRVVEPLIGMAIPALYVLFVLLTYRRCVKACDELENPFAGTGLPIAYIVGLVFMVPALSHAPAAIKVWVAPKLYLLDYVAGLLK